MTALLARITTPPNDDEHGIRDRQSYGKPSTFVMMGYMRETRSRVKIYSDIVSLNSFKRLWGSWGEKIKRRMVKKAANPVQVCWGWNNTATVGLLNPGRKTKST